MAAPSLASAGPLPSGGTHRAGTIAAAQGGYLIESTSLEGAIKVYGREMKRVGFKGAEAPHALRYTWAQEQYARIRMKGMDESEALTRLSLDLGHGDGRGRYCKQTYLQ